MNWQCSGFGSVALASLLLACLPLGCSRVESLKPDSNSLPWVNKPPTFDHDVSLGAAPLAVNGAAEICSTVDCGAPEPSGCLFNNANITTVGVKALHADFTYSSDTNSILTLTAFHRRDTICHKQQKTIACPTATIALSQDGNPSAQLFQDTAIQAPAGTSFKIHVDVRNPLHCEHVEFGFSVNRDDVTPL